MVLLPVTDDQASWPIQQLPVESKLNVVLQILEEAAIEYTPKSLMRQRELDEWFARKGLPAESATDREQVALIMALETSKEIDRLTNPNRT